MGIVGKREDVVLSGAELKRQGCWVGPSRDPAPKLLALIPEMAADGRSAKHQFIELCTQRQMAGAPISRNGETGALRMAGTCPRACSVSSGRARSPDPLGLEFSTETLVTCCGLGRP